MGTLFTATVFLGSTLLFLIQPMMGRVVLPLLGGAPAVWSTCVFFFQAALLCGYLYTFVITRVDLRLQWIVHGIALVVPTVLLPPGLSRLEFVTPELHPWSWLLSTLSLGVGLPFVVLSATSPLLGRWLSVTRHPSAPDPYFLYAASNAGSLLGLLVYPTIIEPSLGLSEATELWSAGYVAFVLFAFTSAVATWRHRKPGSADPLDRATESPSGEEGQRGIGPRRVLRWIALSAVPASLLLGVTGYTTTDLAAVPLLWTLPLALYLLTFILSFARREWIPRTVVLRLLPVTTIVFVLTFVTGATEPLAIVLAGHLVTFFVAALVCHGELARDRPHPRHLAGYYLTLASGGLLGSLFNTAVAPLLFDSVAEYPIALVAACLLCPASRTPSRGTAPASRPPAQEKDRGLVAGDILVPIALGVLTAVAVQLSDGLTLPYRVRMGMTAGVPVLFAYLTSRRPLRFALAVGAVLCAAGPDTVLPGNLLQSHRTFFGVHRVRRTSTQVDGGVAAAFNELYHGTTLHGEQRVDPVSGRPIEPRAALAYYSASSPIGDVVHVLRRTPRPRRVGLVGLGAGSVLAYAEPGDFWTIFEIDPTVKRIAEDERFFTFLAAAREREVELSITLGDARISLARYDGPPFDLLILDAFSSGAVPVHLLTREALRIYMASVADDGWLTFHISNRHLEIDGVLAAVARELGLACRVRRDFDVARDDEARFGRHRSEWAVLARTPERLEALDRSGAPSDWEEIRPAPRVWSDEYSNIWGAFRW